MVITAVYSFFVQMKRIPLLLFESHSSICLLLLEAIRLSQI